MSSNTVFRSVDVRISSYYDRDLQAFTHSMKQLLSTITSPVFSEIVVSLGWWDIHYVQLLEPALRELYRTKEFRVAFCLEVSSWMEEMGQSERELTRMKALVGTGLYDFLPCPPSIFYRMVVKYGCHWAQYEGRIMW